MPLMTQTELTDAGIIQELNRLLLHPMGMELRMTSSTAMVIDDWRIYPEGQIFFNHNAVTFKAQESERLVRVFEAAMPRQGAYGWVVQPIEEVLSARKVAPLRP